MSIFGGIKNASATKSGRYIKEGQHDLVIKEVKTFESSQHRGRHYFCVEAIVKSYRPSPNLEAEYGEGDIVTWMVNMDNAPALDNIKGFVEALMPDVDAASIDEAMMEELTDKTENPAAGIAIRCDAVQITTRKGTPFTKVNWYSADE